MQIGKIEELQEAFLTIIDVRFPSLKELARQKVPQIARPEKLDVLLKAIIIAPDESVARLLIESVAA